MAKKNGIEDLNRIIKGSEPPFEDIAEAETREHDIVFEVFDKNIVPEKTVDRIVTTIQNNDEIAI